MHINFSLAIEQLGVIAVPGMVVIPKANKNLSQTQARVHNENAISRTHTSATI